MTKETLARRVGLPTFTLTKTCESSDPNSIPRVISTTSSAVTYYCKPITVPTVGPLNCNNLQIVVDANGAPWREACLYILSRFESVVGHANMKTFVGIADDLAAFRRFIDEEDIDWTVSPRPKHARPTYRYRGSLMVKVAAGEVAPSTARRRMQTLIGFYRWLVTENRLNPQYPLWNEKDVYIQFTSKVGERLSKVVKSTDVGIRVNKQDDPYDGAIKDGGRLKPLAIDEQERLIETLVEIGNTEMTLIHLVALFTGARLQTLLTMKVRHVHVELPSGANEVPMVCGPGTGIDTKHGKHLTLFFPRWLYEKLRIYSYSDRAITRRRRSARGESDNAYLFVSSHGNPYYDDRVDTEQFDAQGTRRYQASGAAVRVYIAERVLPVMRTTVGKHFHYQLHDLRASFGMNLTDGQLTLVEKGKITLHDAREFVKTRMSHERAATTDGYLQHRRKHRLVEQVQRHYEEHLRVLIEMAKAGDPCNL
jgi:integrase